ncbi:putative zinc finger CCCH domain-containing protein 14 [Apostichopus japonicus]|uniref:Zinc finger CCCH domain-containing protein 14 n=1 Tax=Stichopus japonicus TaxID=307972 RepID=A0A2G8KC83_STIJA|nr:putative zinc finger CCCH domain-containing protein 14 [Apostichopus japonicus]
MNSGKAIRQKIRDAIKAKLVDLGCYVDDELPDYIMVMLANKRSEAQMTQDLDLFLNNNATFFTSWLFELLGKLEQKPVKSEKKKKKKDKSSKHKSQKSEASSSSHQKQSEPAQPATKQTPETLHSSPLEQQEQKLVTPTVSGESSAPVISILSDTHDVLDEELTKEIDADRRKSKQSTKVTHSDPSRGVKQGEAGSGSSSSSSSYRHHVIHQRASKSDSQHLKKPAEKSHGTTTRNVAESTTSQKPKSDVKLRLGERHVEEVIVSEICVIVKNLKFEEANCLLDVSRKRQGLGSVVAQVIHHDVEEESSDEDVSAAKKVASSVRATRRTNVQAVKPAIVREITQRVATSSGRISSSSAGDQGIQSRSLQREFLDRDFDSQTFQTVENQAEGDVDGNEGEHEEQELVEVVPVQGQKGVFVYKNVVAVVGSSRRTVDEAQVEPVNEEEDIEESFHAVIQQEADSRQIYVAENVSVADSTQSPENPLEEEIEEVAFEEVEEEEDGEMQLPEEGYSVEEEGQKVPKGVTQIGASPRFIVTLEGAQRHLNLSANQRCKIQRKAVKRGHAQTAHMPDIVITKQPRKSLSPEVKRQFIFTDTRGPEEVAPVMTPEEMDQEEEEEEESMLVEKAPFMVYSNVPKVEPLTISMQDSDEDEGFEAEEPSQREESNKANERCKFWPACKNGDSCTFMHPTTPCRTFPKCKFGDKCLYIHPNCKFDSLCTKPSCPYTHATRKSVPPVALHLGKPMLHLPAPPPPPRQGVKAACKFHPGCQNPQCTFLHPKLCRFGKGCSRLGCKFFHANVAVRSSLTWTKEAKHISQRPFAAPTSTPAPVPKSAHLHIRPVLTPSPNMSSPPK